MTEAKVWQKNEKGSGIRLEIEFFGFSSSFETLPNYSSFWESVRCVGENQVNLGWNAREPSTELGSILMTEVRRHLGQDAPSLRLCCALGSPLDLYHGVDGFFFLVPIRNFIVSFDLSENWEKKPRQKAHFLISRADLLNPHSLDSLAKNIAMRLVIGKKKKSRCLNHEVRVG